MIEFIGTNHGFLQPEEADQGRALPGGIVKRFKAAAQLLIGDAVLYSAVDTVTKTATATDHDQRIGIVVGGARTHGSIISGSDALGEIAAEADEDVLVCIAGICWGVADANTVAFGDKLRLGTTTAGRLLDGADTTDLAAGITGRIVGTALDSAAAAGDPIRVLVALG